MQLYILNYFDTVFHSTMALWIPNTVVIFPVLLAKLHHRSGCFLKIAIWAVTCGNLELQKILNKEVT